MARNLLSPPVVAISVETRFALSFSLALIASIVVQVQPALAQTPTPPPEPPPRLEASAQFAFLDTRGNADSQSLGTGADVIWRPTPWTYTAKAILAQVETEGDLSARSFATLFRAARTINPRLAAYGQYDFLRDVFAGIEQRNTVEGGLSYLVLTAERHKLQFDAGIGYLYENRPDDHFDSATLSLAAPYRFIISPTSDFRYEPRFLLSFVEADAWRFDQDVQLTVALNTILSLKVGHTLRYSAEPPAGFDTTDTIMAVSLVAKFRRPQ
jgi:putative salt-induced outer membrane protein